MHWLIIVFLMFSNCTYYVTIPHGAMGSYTVCDCGIEIYLAPSLSEVSHIIDSIYHNKLILSLSVCCKQMAGLNVVSNSFGVVIFWGISWEIVKSNFLNHFRIPRKVVDLF